MAEASPLDDLRRFYRELDSAPADRFFTACDDATAFLRQWSSAAEGLGWSFADLFGSPATGLVGKIRGGCVVAMTRDSAAIRSTSGKVTIYRRPKPAFG
jgi:hypothetical protein